MKELQTPHKVSARSAENRNGRSKEFPSKKSNKIMDKSLNAAFTSVSVDSVFSSPVSEITHVHSSEDASNFSFEEPSSVTLFPTPSDTTEIRSTNSFGSLSELEDSNKLASVEAEIALNFLKNVKPEVLTSVNAAPQYKKLVDEIIEYIIRDLNSNTLQEDRDGFDQVLSAKNRLLFLCIFIWFIGVLAVYFFTSDNHCGPTPT